MGMWSKGFAGADHISADHDGARSDHTVHKCYEVCQRTGKAERGESIIPQKMTDYDSIQRGSDKAREYCQKWNQKKIVDYTDNDLIFFTFVVFQDKRKLLTVSEGLRPVFIKFFFLHFNWSSPIIYKYILMKGALFIMIPIYE